MIRLSEALVLVSLALLSGCYQSSEPLGSPDQSQLDSKLVGTWICRSANPDSKEEATLRVMPFDERQYYVEWADGDELTRYRAYSSQINGITLVNIRELVAPLGGDRWAFVGYHLAQDGSLRLSLVRDDALEGFTGKAALQEIRKRVREDSLYVNFAVCGAASN
jgi:hypothetical protein